MKNQSLRISLFALGVSFGVLAFAPVAVTHAQPSEPLTRPERFTASDRDALRKQVEQQIEQRRKEIDARREELREKARQARENGGDTSKPQTVPSREDIEALREKAREMLPPTEERQTELKAKGQQIVEELRKKHEDRTDRTDRTDQEKSKGCEARRTAMENRLRGLYAKSEAMQKRLDGALAKSVEYQQKQTLTSPELAAALAAATAAQTKVAGSIEALLAAAPAIDCEDPTATAEGVATYKAAAEQVRTDMQAYLKSLRDVMKQLSAAKPIAAPAEGEDN